ncbi:MAG: hypothetical protein EOM22_15875 [Gammaproteobacteria bacterium]|nr:hypothetical protein [Gammaproteobacteria bacterium]
MQNTSLGCTRPADRRAHSNTERRGQPLPVPASSARHSDTDASLDRNSVRKLAHDALGDTAAERVFDHLEKSASRWSRRSVLRALFRAKVALRNAHLENTKARLLDVRGGNLIGLELKSASSEQWAIILPDASEPGRFRCQLFDSRGFYSHRTRDTVAKVLEELVEGDFTVVDMGALRRLSMTQEWRDGMALVEEIRKFNSRPRVNANRDVVRS